METGELLKKVRKIEIKTRGLSRHIFSGEYHSAFKGRGMSFSEVREYQYGDDIRSIDWNVTARFNSPYIKVFEEERELTAMLMVDVSASSFFGSGTQMKNEVITEICAVLAFAAIQNNDKVGVVFFSDQVEKYIPPKKGKSHILRIIRELLDFKAKHTRTDIGEAFKFLNNVTKKRSIVFMLSDFMDDNYKDPLNIAARRHDVVGIRIYDKRERILPAVGMMRVVDAETGKVKWIDSSSKTAQTHYEKYHEERYHYFKKTFLQTGASLLDIETEESYVNALLKFFKRR